MQNAARNSPHQHTHTHTRTTFGGEVWPKKVSGTVWQMAFT